MMNQSLPSHIMVIDQNQLFREKIAFLLSQNHHYKVIADFANINAGMIFLQQQSIDLLLIEAELLTDDNQFFLLKNLLLSQPQLQIILLTSYYQPFLQSLSKRLGVDHTLTKMIEPNELLAFIAKRLQNQSHASKPSNYLETLTPRELEILEWLVKGDSNKEIARELQISESTVKVHVQNILKKIKVSSRVEAAVYAVRNELNI